MTIAGKYIDLLRKGEKTLTFSEKEEIVNYIFCNFLDDEHQKKEIYFVEGWKRGHSSLIEWEAMKDYLYYEYGYDYMDALTDLDMMERENWEGLK